MSAFRCVHATQLSFDQPVRLTLCFAVLSPGSLLQALRITLDKVVAQLQGAQAICLLTASDNQNTAKCMWIHVTSHGFTANVRFSPCPGL